MAGAYSPFGYVCRKDAMGQATKKRTAVITIHPRTLEIDKTMCKYCCLPLPATDGEFDKVKDEMDIDSFTGTYIYGEEYPRKLEEYEEQPEQGMTIGGM